MATTLLEPFREILAQQKQLTVVEIDQTAMTNFRYSQVFAVSSYSLIVELARAGAFPSSDILQVAAEFENPRHEEFKERNAWNLYQDCTEIMKSQSPARQVEGFKALNRVLTAAFN